MAAYDNGEPVAVLATPLWFWALPHPEFPELNVGSGKIRAVFVMGLPPGATATYDGHPLPWIPGEDE